MKFTYTNGSTPLDGYTIKRGIGVGGFGEVYFATTPAGKEVALKRIQRNLDIELRGVAHCLNLKHPNLLQLFDVRHDADGEAWVVMEYIGGKSLRDVLDQHPAGLSRDDVAHWFGQLAAAVAHLHANGIVHRDLKPANVFEDGNIVKLGDYGLSKFISCSQRGGHTESVGTFHYMAPEIGRGEYGKEIDIYALGIILYELLTGRVPFDGESSHEIVMKHLTAQPDLSIVPQPYRDVISHSLAKSPQARPASVSELLRPLGMTIDPQGLVRVITDSQASRPTESWPPSPPVLVPQDGTSAAIAPLPEEPVFRAVRTSLRSLVQWWQGLEHSPFLRFFVLAAAVIILLMNGTWLPPIVSLLIMMYIPYFVIRQMILDSSPQPGPPLAQPIVHGYPPAAIAPAKMPRKQWLQLARAELNRKPRLFQSAELSGSGSVATIGLGIAYGVAALILSRQGHQSPSDYSPLVWSGSVALVGTWLMLALGKLWEGREASGETFLRRLMLLGSGALVGMIAFGLSQYLLLDDGFGVHPSEIRFDWTNASNWSAYSEDNRPLLPAYAMHFGLVLAALRWWKLSDPLRRSRLSLWLIFVAVGFSWLLNIWLPIPQPWGFVAVGSMAAAIQIAAPWVSPAARVVA